MSGGGVPKPPAKSKKGKQSAASRPAQAPKQAGDADGLEQLKAMLESEDGEISVIVQRHHIHSGPLPPPSELREYDDILPGLADRIMEGWESEMVHRRSTQKRGQYFALTIALAAIGSAVVTAYFGQPFVAAAIVIATMLGIGVTAALGTVFSRR